MWKKTRCFPLRGRLNRTASKKNRRFPFKQNSVEVHWPSLEQFSLDHPPKKASRCSSTVAPSLLSNIDAGKLGPTSPVDLTRSDSSTYAPEATPPLESTMNHQLYKVILIYFFLNTSSSFPQYSQLLVALFSFPVLLVQSSAD